jgi:hypothetical protein
MHSLVLYVHSHNKYMQHVGQRLVAMVSVDCPLSFLPYYILHIPGMDGWMDGWMAGCMAMAM